MSAAEEKPQANTVQLTIWRLRFKKGVKSASDDELERASEWFARAEIFFGGVVAFGILLEFAIAWVHPPYDSPLGRFGTTIADALIGLGIVFEILASSRERLCEGVLARRLNIRLSESNDRAASAEREAGLAHERAANAQLETEKLKAVHAWRRFTPEQLEILNESLQGLPASLSLTCLSRDPETVMFSEHLTAVFRRAGWHVAVSMAEGHSGSVFGLCIPIAHGENAPASSRIHQAFSKAKIGYMLRRPNVPFSSTFLGDAIGSPNGDIFVGAKRPREII